MTEARPSNYWIASNALYITLNANGGPDYLLGNTASGAHILCYMKGIDGLEYDAGHNYRRWPLSLTPTHFETHTEKYVYCAIPRPGNAAEMAVIVFPSEHLDIYGKNEIGRQIGSEQYYYIWLQGIISSSGVTGANDRGWTQHIDTGTLASDEAMNAGGDETWWRYSSVDDTVTFLKEIVMDAKSVFHNLKARLLVLAGHELTGVATADTSDEFVDSETLVVTPSYLKKNTEEKFLRKDQDDATPYSLTVGGNLSVGGILRAVTGYFTSLYSNLVQSTNYTGEGIADTGYRLTADDGTGSSALTVDNLHVRNKATFEELEVKKETSVAGNEIRSAAANVINRTDYIDQNGEIIGYSNVKVPWMLRKMPFLLRHKFFGRLRRVRITIDPEHVGDIKKIRCYFLAKDGDRDVKNLWRAHDLVRCQTFNISRSNRFTYIGTASQSKTGNVFWWRKAVLVSTSPVAIDDKEYHYFDVSMDDCAANSDIPCAGDHAVQFGNDSDSERMNLIIQEVNGTDAPAIKAYTGIYTYDLNKCWWGGATRKMMLSPKEGYEFYGPSFKFVQEYGQAPASIDRGAWADIPTGRDDYEPHAQVRKCYYNDKVSHNGCYWRCVMSQVGAHWVDASGNYLTQAQYDALPADQKLFCTRRQNYVTSQPGTDDTAWEKLVDKGEKGDSITKSSEVVYYIKNTTGVRPAENDPNWSTTKPTIGKGEWLFTKIVITWSDNSKTVLYTDERNPNDGIAGQDIIVDGATEMKYYVGDSNTTHPAEDSSDWKDLSQVTQTQGKWLWSKATTWYRKASSAAGSKDAGHSVNYNVSYISKDGKTGRGIQSITEYYQATSSSAARQKPTSESGWDTDPNLSHLTDKWDANHKYLWNMEKTVYTNVDGSTTTEYSIPQILAIWTKDGDAGRGIDSIQNKYCVTSSSTTPAKEGQSGAPTWYNTPLTPSQGQYLWNYEIITWVNGTPATTETDVQMIGYAGTDGKSITKQSEVAYYIKNTTGVRPAENDPNWSTTKPTIGKGEWLFTKTVITWSDNSKTVLYTDERNPNDGAAGQDIIVDGATEMKYYVGDSNTTHPAEDSSDWKDLSQVTQTQGKWLWSKATTWYRKASSAAGSKDAGHSVNYNVSYISKDGKTGRGIQSITEYYQATSSSAARQKPTSESGWDTDPNLSHLTDKWDANHKYLWNMEKTVYTNVDGSTTTEYSIPKILAIWTKDGNAGRGIDSITNYYKVTSSATAPSKPATPGTGGWSITPTAPGQGEYLWNYEIITWVNPSGTDETDVQMIGYAGTNGRTPQKGVDYTDGANAVGVSLSPEEVLVTQSTTSPYNIDLSNAETVVSVNEGGVPKTFTISNVVGTHCSASVKSGTTDTIKITSIGTYNATVDGETVSRYYDNGYVTFDVTYGGNTYHKRFNFYANLLGTWKESVEAGTKTEVARSLTYGYDPEAGEVIPIENFGSFIKSSEENISIISRQINDPTTGLVTQISTIDQKADRISLSVESKENTNLVPDPDIYQMLNDGSVTRDIRLVKGRTYTLTARLKNISSASATCNIKINTTPAVTLACSLAAGAVDNFSKTFTAPATGTFILTVPQTANVLLEWLQVEQGSAFTKHDNIGSAFQRTGIDIENGLIKATTDNFVICNSSGTQTFSVDSDGNLVSSGSAKFSGTIEAKGGTIGGFVIGTSNIHSAAEDSSHNPLIQLNNDGSARIGGLVVANNGDATLTGTINATGGNISGNLTVGEVAAHRYHFEFKPKEAAGGTGSYSYYSAQLIGYSDNSATSKEEIFSIKMGEFVEVDYQTLGWEPTIRLLTSYINPYRFYFERTIKNKTYSIRNELHEKNSSLKTSAWRDGSLVTMEIGVINGKCNIVSYDNGSNIGWITDSQQTPVGGVYVTEMLGRMVMCVRT